MPAQSPENPASPVSSADPSPSEEASSEPAERHEQIQAELRELLQEVQTSFRPFEDTIFTKIDAMQHKIDQLGSSVADLSVTTKPDPASGGNGSPVRAASQGPEYTQASAP